MSSCESYDAPAPNEIRVKKNTEPLKFVYEAFCFFEKEDKVIFSGIGMAINHVVEVAEMTKRRMKGLHQFCELGMKEVMSRRLPRTNGRRGRPGVTTDNSSIDSHNQTAEQFKIVPYIRITLSKTGSGINRNAAGYQEPLKSQDVTVLTAEGVKQELENSKFSAKYKVHRRPFRGMPMWSYKKYRYDRERYDRDRYDRDRYDRDRYDRDRYDRDRYDRDRYDRERYDRERYDRDRYDRERYDRDRHDRDRIERERFDRDRVNRNRLQRDRYERNEPARYERDRLERDRERFDKDTSNKDRFRIIGHGRGDAYVEESRAKLRKGKRSYSRRF